MQPVPKYKKILPQMIKARSVSSFRSTRLLLGCLIVLCHCMIIVFLSRTNLRANVKLSNSVMTIVPIYRSGPADPVARAKPTANKNWPKQRAIKNSIDTPIQTIDTNVSELKNRSRNESASNSLSGVDSAKDLTTLGSIANRYRLQVPKSAVEETLTPAQQAAQDVRSNSAKLTKNEKFAVAMGTLDCIFQARLPDGKVVREPGKWVEVAARSNLTSLVLAKSRFCVRLHQAEDANGNDLTAISSGIKGKL